RRAARQRTAGQPGTRRAMAADQVDTDGVGSPVALEPRARLRIYIGAAPGVGKTYALLQEAHALRARGLDVVIAMIETYGRADTDAQVKDLEIVPPRGRRYP